MKYLNCAVIAYCLAAFGAVTYGQASPPAGYTLVWSDEFSGTSLDTTHWSYQSSGLPVSEGGYDSSTAVSVANDFLTITTYTGTNGEPYSGMIGTTGQYQPLYGYMEAMISFSNSPGNWSAFWTFVDTIGESNLPHTDGVEADIAEHRAVDYTGTNNISTQIDSALHWDGYGADEQTAETSPSLRGSGLNSGFHKYGLLWTATSQTFSIDGSDQWTVTNSSHFNPISPLAAVSQVSQGIILSTIVENASWAGAIPAGGYGTLTSSTTKMVVDYVRVYQNPPAVPSAPVNLTLGPSLPGRVLAWDMADNAPYYNVKRSTISGGPYTTIATTGIAATGSNYLDATATSRTVYYYVVSAVNGPNEGPNSLEVSTSASGTTCCAHSGQWGAQAILSGSPTYDRITQAAPVVSNTTYQAGVWVMGSGDAVLRIYDSGTANQLAGHLIVATPSWTYYSISANSGSNTQLVVRLDDGSKTVGAVSVDDVFLGIAGGTNVLVNPGFESGTAGWNMTEAGSIWKVMNYGGSRSGNEYDGYQAVQGVFTGTSSGDYIDQTAPVVSNTVYQVGIWAKGGGGSTLCVYSGSTSLTSLVIAPTPVWTYYSVAFNTGTNTQLTFTVNDYFGTAATMYMDDAFMGVASGINVLVNGNFERGTVGWDTSHAGNVWAIGEFANPSPVVVTGYDKWDIDAFGQQYSDAAIGGPGATPLRDGIPNALKYLCDINPSVPMSSASIAALPRPGLVTVSGTQYVALTFRQNQNLSGLGFTIQTSTNLATWENVNPGLLQTGGTDNLTGDPIVQIGVPAGGVPELFLRLQISAL
jgi:beta-glucanase (GH16 family)